ncbi:multiheme c-type cytochrome [Sulfurimonas sp.]|uniref:multiheme c-type cytochrome n=1 Tax=Sulfurimonas sp. TaxID=2022749 RepID=UPI002AAF2057|nr:multiheme c-type cytochrome [Sulfurimonas sp.]
MKKVIYITLLLLISSFSYANESKVCQKCHPIIYDEYYKSSHRKASTVNNPIHKALWDKHPKDADGYSCAKCHSPSDKELMATGILKENKIQKEEPISCVYCHTITDVKEGTNSNTNLITNKKREFYTAQADKKGSKKAEYQTKSSFFGLVKVSQNSPFHKIDYNNENYYNGNVCMGCHSHVNNEHSFDITMLDAMIDKKDKNNCVTCHMPQVSGTKVTLNESKTHAFHGIAGIYHMNKEMGKYIDFSIDKKDNNFIVKIINKSNHALFGQAFREGVLQVTILRNGKTISLKPFIFTRILAKDGKEVMPWLANETLKDTLIYAKKDVIFESKILDGDKITLTLGVRRISKEASKKLNLQNNKEVTKLKILKNQSFNF